MRRIKTDNFIQVTKPTAKKLLKEGTNVYMVPCNFNPESPWAIPCEMNLELETFDKQVLYFESYNCINTETGKYTRFYIKRA